MITSEAVCKCDSCGGIISKNETVERLAEGVMTLVVTLRNSGPRAYNVPAVRQLKQHACSKGCAVRLVDMLNITVREETLW